MVEEDIGEATIVYEDPDGGTIERTVENEHVAYFQEHWIVRAGEDEEGRDLVHRIPRQRVYHVERTVEEFEEEVATLRDQVQSVAGDLRSKILGGDESDEGVETEVHEIEVEGEDAGEDDDASEREDASEGGHGPP